MRGYVLAYLRIFGDSYAFADSHTFVGRYGYKLSHTNFGIYADIYIRIRIAAQ